MVAPSGLLALVGSYAQVPGFGTPTLDTASSPTSGGVSCAGYGNRVACREHALICRLGRASLELGCQRRGRRQFDTVAAEVILTSINSGWPFVRAGGPSNVASLSELLVLLWRDRIGYAVLAMPPNYLGRISERIHR
ncbi:hypothetical protein [Bythopirellula polymerisocia]|uniref:Uncharacterized protein n=1 Tax=Bythopirellula polymerisocia TaxID=2528003 RepID=A0A5C6CVD0_9BACT|nr:hypothetical protein [Bythopirellula polymerisocia]TWU27624.1 hypothetical protein Pla144_24010 [Bythopirellula polymerisocia]